MLARRMRPLGAGVQRVCGASVFATALRSRDTMGF
nr:MAG TPA: hypothetical protein [Caudoviricetes sp.]DAS24824.1 MAG TPA: hypothetical protein [Caudoviricetes sp.]